MRPGQFYDRPPMWPIPPAANGRAWGKQGCIHLRTSSYAVFNINGQEVEQVQADFLQSDSTSPAYIKNKPQVVQSDFQQSDSTSPAYIKNKPTISGGSAWDQGETPQDQGNSGMYWDQ